MPTSNWPGLRSLSESTGPTNKTFFSGTHRTISPAETCDRMARHFEAFGVTRVANLTGLDNIGIPVAQAYRPNSRALSVSQGKGADLDAAFASAIMESIEFWHAERIALPLRRASVHELRTERLIDLENVPRRASARWSDHEQTLWFEGLDLMSGDSVWVPERFVDTDQTRIEHLSACFVLTSNGLASGNHPIEAIAHGLYEVIERDATALALLAEEQRPGHLRIDLDTVSSPTAKGLIEQCRSAGVFVAAWDVTTDVGLPCVDCVIFDDPPNPFRPLTAAAGFGCHASRDVAFSRALTEAAQSRLTVIAGARDDLRATSYTARRTGAEAAAMRAHVRETPAEREFEDLPSVDCDTVTEDVATVLGRLRDRGIEEAVVVDLTKAEFDIPVFRVIVPGLENVGTKDTDYQPGRRARAMLEGRR